VTGDKRSTSDLALFGGPVTFGPSKSIGSLADPDLAMFLGYSRIFFDQKRYSNNGPVNQLLEARLAEWHGTKRCVTFSSAFWGISLAIRLLAIPGRSEVITPSLTYRRMGEIIASAGMVPRYCDIDPDTLAQTAATTAICVSDDTALILGAAGLENLSMRTGIPLLFDSVESAFETVGGRRVGTFGLGEAFSIHATKLVNGFEGGYLVTNDDVLADKLVLMRGFGIRDEDQVAMFGINAKLNEIHAAMALASLDGLPALVERNRQRYLAYRSLLQDLPGVSLRQFDPVERTSYKNILVRFGDSWPLTRDDTLALLQAEGALARPYYSPALHTHQTDFETRYDELPVAETVSGQYALLPCGDQMSLKDVATVVELLTFLWAHADEIRGELGRMGERQIHTGYDPVALPPSAG
jgi:dTDP-4-amino-4,6-dideoxygalactose transaminase